MAKILKLIEQDFECRKIGICWAVQNVWSHEVVRNEIVYNQISDRLTLLIFSTVQPFGRLVKNSNISHTDSPRFDFG